MNSRYVKTVNEHHMKVYSWYLRPVSHRVFQKSRNRWPLSSRIISTLISQFFPGCWVDNVPKGCIEDECKSPMIAWIIGGSITVFVIVSLLVNYCCVTFYVRHRYGQNVRNAPSESQTILPTTTAQRRYSGSLHPLGQARRIRLVSTQASLYIGTFFLTYSWYVALQIAESINAVDRPGFPAYPLMIVQAIFSPMAGFWNALIFFRPTYLTLRRRANAVARRRRRREQRANGRNHGGTSYSSDSGSDWGDSDDDNTANVSRWYIMRSAVFGLDAPTAAAPPPPHNDATTDGNAATPGRRFLSVFRSIFRLVFHSVSHVSSMMSSKDDNAREMEDDIKLDCSTNDERHPTSSAAPESSSEVDEPTEEIENDCDEGDMREGTSSLFEASTTTIDA